MAESIDDYFERSGPLPVAWNERRRFPRFYFRSCADAVIHSIDPSKPTTQCVVLTRDISRTGLGLIHQSPLYPGQKVDIVLNGEPPRRVEVVWCRQMEDQRFMIGCRFQRSEVEAAKAEAEAGSP